MHDDRVLRVAICDSEVMYAVDFHIVNVYRFINTLAFRTVHAVFRNSSDGRATPGTSPFTTRSRSRTTASPTGTTNATGRLSVADQE